MRAQHLAGIFAILVLSACGPKVKLAPEVKERRLTTVALLPVSYPEGIRRERVDYIRAALSNELQSNGLIVLDDKVVSSTCSTPACPEKTKLAESYKVDGLVRIDVESESRNNFIAGYWNSITGKLTIDDTKGQQLVEVDHTERERGGLVFESGQVLQGVISQVKNAGDDSFNNLANKFVRRLVSELPAGIAAPAAASGTPEESLAIKSVDLKPLKGGVYEVCAQGSPRAIASLVVARRKSNLRENPAGRYCGIYRLGEIDGKMAVEVRSAYGDTIKRDLTLPGSMPCSLNDKVRLVKAGGHPSLEIHCTRIGKGSEALGRCADAIQQCEGSRFVVYRAPTDQGPFEKIADFASPRWRDPAGAVESRYEVVSVTSAGVRSMPVAPSEPKENK